MARTPSPLTRRVIGSLSCVALAISTVTAAAPPRPDAPAADQARPARTTPTARRADLPLAFEDRGPKAGYFAHAGVFDLSVTPTGTIIMGHDGTTLRLELAGANRNARQAGIDRLPGVVNYLVGRDKATWRTNVPTYGGVSCKGVYKGIDSTYRDEEGKLVWDFDVAPNADPRAIAIDVTGASDLSIGADGALVVKTPAGEFREDAPVVYQDTSSGRTTIASRYALRGAHAFGFELGAYDTTRRLVIDPTISFNFPIGGNGHTFAFAVALDTRGNTYVVGSTAATDLPTMGAIDTSLGGDHDAFVAKLNGAGALVYSTYLGGSHYDSSQAIAVDATGAAYVAGETGFADTDDFPVTPGAFQTQFGGAADVFVAKLAPDGASLVYATYLGGALSYDGATGIAVDATGRAYVCGATVQNFPTVNALQPQPAGGAEGFLARINPAGSSLEYSTYVGGTGNDACTSIALLANGQCVTAGYTTSLDLPTRNPVQAQNGGLTDAFVAVCDPDGSALTFCTYLGGSQNDSGYGCAADPAGHVYCTGNTYSPDFPVKNPIDTSHCGDGADACPDAFVCEMDPSTSSIDYCTYLGGSGIDGCNAIAVDEGGTVLCTGNTTSVDFPEVNPLPGGSGGSGGAFITRIVPGGSAIDFSSVFGGTDGTVAFGIAVNEPGTKAAVAYTSGLTIEVGGALGVEFEPRNMADVQLTQTGAIGTLRNGVFIGNYFGTVVNNGPDNAEGVTVTIDAPCGFFRGIFNLKLFEVVEAPPTNSPIEIVLRVPQALAPGQKAQFAFMFTNDPQAACFLVSRTISISTRATSTTVDPRLDNNSETRTVGSDSAGTIISFAKSTRGAPVDLTLTRVQGSGSGLVPLPWPTGRVANGGKTSAALSGYHVYNSTLPNVQAIPSNLFTTLPPEQTSADVTGATAGSYFVVTAFYGDGTESAPSNEVGGSLPTIDSVVVSAKKITATGSGFSVGEAVSFGGIPFATPAKLKKNNTKLVQKGTLVIGETPAEALTNIEAGSTILIVFIDPKGNGVGYVFTR